MAHGFLQSLNPELKVFSAGTAASGCLNPKAIEVMAEVGIDISHHSSDSVEQYLEEPWDFVITVCGGANESCPVFEGVVKTRLHIGFDDPSDAEGTEAFIHGEFLRIRDEIEIAFRKFYETQIQH